MVAEKTILFGLILVLLICFSISMSPRWLRRIYYLLLLISLILTVVSYHELSQPKDWKYSVIKGLDHEKKEAIFKVQILNDNFTWKLKSNEIVQLNGEDIDIKPFLNSPENILEYREALEIICLGNSSHEGNPVSEENRANRRAKKLAIWLKELIPQNFPKIRTLNLGINLKQTSESAYQRRLIIILVLRKDENTNISIALKNALINYKILPFDIQEYSKFELI